jgi:hypothetical protein
MSTCEVLTQLLENIVPRLPIPVRKGRNPIGAEPSQTRAIAASIIRFHVSVVIEPHLAFDEQESAQCDLLNGRSMVTPEFVVIGWKYLRRYFRLAELYIAERRNRHHSQKSTAAKMLK